MCELRNERDEVLRSLSSSATLHRPLKTIHLSLRQRWLSTSGNGRAGGNAIAFYSHSNASFVAILQTMLVLVDVAASNGV